MARVTHTVDVVYGSYSTKDYKVVCDENADLDTIKGIVRRELSLNFLAMASCNVKITDTQRHDDEISDSDF